MKAKEANLETLKEAIIKVNNDLSIDGLVLDMLLNELETRISEEDFIDFCEEL